MPKTLLRWALNVACLALLTASLAAQTGRTKIILDTDIGSDIDDAWALAFILAHPEFDLLGVTIADGNTPARAKVACKMLAAVGRGDVPVAVGRQTGNKFDYQFAWAEDFAAKQPIKTSAADFIVEQVRRYPGQIVLIAVGPLQNVADALRREPKLGQLVKRIVLMSGCVRGTATSNDPIAEYNVYMATPDSQLVYGAGLPLTIVPLDATTHVRLSDAERAQVRQYDSPLTRSLEALYRLWLNSPTARMTLHDQLAIVEAANPGAYFNKLETLPIYVDEKGFTRVDAAKGKPVTVCFEPKRDEFMKYYVTHLTAQRLGIK